MNTVFFFNDTATTEIYTLSLHDALPISGLALGRRRGDVVDHHVLPRRERDHHPGDGLMIAFAARKEDRKSTRLNSSHSQISYAVFCLKKKNDCSHDSRMR